MRSASVHSATTQPDTAAPLATMRPPCNVQAAANLQFEQYPECTPGPGLKFCDNIQSNSVSLSLRVNEAGATYFMMSELSADMTEQDWFECEALKLYPGMMYAVPQDEQWSGCSPPGRRRGLLSARSLRGQASRTSAVQGTGALAQADSIAAGDSNLPNQTPLMSARILLQDTVLDSASITPRPGCVAEQPCDCCAQNVNCRLTFEQAFGGRADIDRAGPTLTSACAYMYASPCTEMPVIDALEGAAPAGPAPTGRKLRSDRLGDTDLVSARHGAASRSLLQTQGSMELAVNDASSEYRQPVYRNPAWQGGLQPDTYYAVFAVTEDQIRPIPNRLVNAHEWIFRTQRVVPPTCSVSCPAAASTLTSVRLDVQMNTTGTVHYVVQRSTGVAELSAAEV